MSVSVKRSVVGATSLRGVLLHGFWFVAAALFVAILALTYGLDLSAGLF
jgi:hypothetical protein